MGMSATGQYLALFLTGSAHGKAYSLVELERQALLA